MKRLRAAWVVQAPVGFAVALGVEDSTGGHVNEQQDVEPIEQGGVDGEEVAGHCGLGPQQLRPGNRGALGSWINTVAFEDLPHGGSGDVAAEADEFAVDCAGSPRSGCRRRDER